MASNQGSSIQTCSMEREGGKGILDGVGGMLETQWSWNWFLAPWLVIRMLRVSVLLHDGVGVQSLLENH